MKSNIRPWVKIQSARTAGSTQAERSHRTSETAPDAAAAAQVELDSNGLPRIGQGWACGSPALGQESPPLIKSHQVPWRQNIQLREAGKGIFNRYIRFFEEGRKGPEEVMLRWVSSARYSPGTGTVTLRFTQEVAPHLLQLKAQFTTYKLAQASALRSIYSWRLLELLSQSASTGWRQMSIDEFHHAMETPETARANFKDCRKRVIEPAVKELIEKDGWLIEWQPIKEGRKVAAIRFEFRRDPQGRLDL